MQEQYIITSRDARKKVYIFLTILGQNFSRFELAARRSWNVCIGTPKWKEGLSEDDVLSALKRKQVYYS